MTLYIAYNGVPSTSATVPFAAVTTGTTTKTLLQLATPSTQGLRIVEWGISFDGTAVATPIKVELLSTAGTGSTVTPHAAGTGVLPFHNPGAAASQLTFSTTTTGYTSSSETAPSTVTPLDTQLVSPTNQYVKQWPLGREPVVAVSRLVRLRVTAGAAVNAICYIIWDENLD
jgi:hypothetical protein